MSLDQRAIHETVAFLTAETYGDLRGHGEVSSDRGRMQREYNNTLGTNGWVGGKKEPGNNPEHRIGFAQTHVYMTAFGGGVSSETLLEDALMQLRDQKSRESNNIFSLGILKEQARRKGLRVIISTAQPKKPDGMVNALPIVRVDGSFITVAEFSKESGQGGSSNAVAKESQDVGGIDLNPNQLRLLETGDRVDINGAIDFAMQSDQIDGFAPVIFSVTPMGDPQVFFAGASR